jgi:hypothetical protein
LWRLSARLTRAMRFRRRNITFFPSDRGDAAGQCFRPASDFDLPAGWAVVQLKLPGVEGPVAASLALDGEDSVSYPPLFLGAADKARKFNGHPQFRYIPALTRNFRLSLFGATAALPSVRLVVWQLGPLSFLLYLLLRAPQVPLGWVLRSRDGGLKLQAFRATYLLQSGRSPISYETWLGLFETEALCPAPTEEELAKSKRDVVLAVLIERTVDIGGGVAATLASLERQRLQPERIEVVERGAQGLADMLTTLGDDPRITHIVMLGAGTRVANDALAKIAMTLADSKADIAYPDHDRFATGIGRRHSPQFQPSWCNPLPHPLDLAPGLLALRKNCPGLVEAVSRSGLKLSLTAVQRNLLMPGSRLRVVHIPQILCHVPDDIADPAADDLDGRSVATSNPQFGDTRGAQAKDTSAAVTVVIASAFRQGVADRFLPRILEQTSCRTAQYVITVHESRLTDPANADLLQRLKRDARVHVVPHAADPFNFAMVANGAAAQAAGGEFLCFLNDDIDVIEGHWLDRLISVMDDPRIGAVSARLLYPDGCIQHDGVVVGLMGSAEHWNRFAVNDNSLYPAAGIRLRDVSAATGACLLVRRDAFKSVGGFDERFSVGYNDIDLCLRLGNGGWRVTVATNIELYHCETASLNREESLAASRERSLFRMTWRSLLASEPYFNPNVSLATATTFALAVPPRDRSPRVYGVAASVS